MGIEKLFSAKTIALIGASHQAHKVGHDILKNLLESKRKIYPVNPKATRILGVKAYPTVQDIKGKIDLAIIAVPAQVVPKVMQDCAKKGIKYVMIISAGFSEIGKKELEQSVTNIAKRNGMRILGPNCLGIIDAVTNLNATFFNKMPAKGNISFISQSGALGIAVLDWAIKKKIGLSKFISIGNIADINAHEIIDYLNEDPETKAICLYIESLKNGRAFIESAKKSKKPIVVLKAGATSSGAKAAASHTGALATENAIYDGAFKQCGISRVDTLFQLFEVAQVHALNECLIGRRALIISNAGGAGVIASDAFERNDLEVVKLPAILIKELDKVLPQTWSHNNPIDIVGDALPERYEAVLKSIENGNFFDFVFVILTPQTMTQPEKVAKILSEFNKRFKKPCFACFMGGTSIDKAKNILSQNLILNFDEPEYGAEVISKCMV